MTFFRQAIMDGTIDEKIEMNEEEFEMMLKGMLQDSNAWDMHKRKHHDARIVPIFQEDTSEFEDRVHKSSKKQEEPHVIQYDMHSKKFVAGCQCGEKFQIDVNTDKVESVDPSLKMKEIQNYDRGAAESSQQYGGAGESPNPTYNAGPKRPQHNPGYNSGNGSGYRN